MGFHKAADPLTPFRLNFTPTSDRSTLITATETFVGVLERPVLLVSREDGRLHGALPSPDTALLDQLTCDLPRRLGDEHTACAVTGQAIFDQPQHALLVMPVPQKSQFQNSLPPVVQNWSARPGLKLAERRGSGQPSTVIWGRSEQGEFLLETLIAMSTLVRLPEEADPLQSAQEHFDALAVTLGVSDYWLLHSAGADHFTTG